MSTYFLRMALALLTFASGLATMRLYTAVHHRVVPGTIAPQATNVVSPTEAHHDFQATAEVSLPTNMKSALDRRFPGWRYLPVEAEIRKFLQDYVSKFARPEIISGDFDGDGLLDYAILIEEQMTVATEPRKADLVVFLNRNAHFEMKVLEPEGNYLVLRTRGDWDYDFVTSRYFNYQHDAIFAGIFEKAGTSYVYKKGSFHTIVTSD